MDKKTYDSKLMKRLLKYTFPYWKLLLFSLILLMILTVLELLNPYLLKVAIDDYISIDKTPIYELDLNYPKEGVVFNGYKYISKNSLDKNQIIDLNNNKIKKIMKHNKNYYLVDFKSKNIENGEILSTEKYREFRNTDIEGLKRVSILFFIVISFTFVFNYIQIYLLNYTGQNIIFNIRKEVFNHIKSLSIAYFDKNPVGRLVTRVTNDTETLNEMYTSVLINLFKDIFMLIGIIIIMLQLDYKLALIPLSLTPVVFLITIVFRKYIRILYRRGRIQLAKINSSLNENISGIRIIQIFNKEKNISNEFDDINKDYLETKKKEVFTFAIFRPSIEIMKSLGIALLIYFGGRKVVADSIEFGVLYLFINYLRKFFIPILDLAEKYNILQASMAASERIFSVLDTHESIVNYKPGKKIINFKGKIEFKNVWFAYEDENWVLKDISFKINPGQTVAIVGATGAGKSSIINLLTRFYDIQYGEILIDNINIKDIDKYELRKTIGIVLQDVFIFTGDIKDNIRLNQEDIDTEKIKEVSRYVNADNFINNLPNKYDEAVMERGATLSAGEKQLLAFARTLAYDPKILILDEATSNIDTETELLIQDALKKLIRGRTSIAIAHRLSTIQYADNIIVLSNGEIKEMGNHQELLNKGEIYYNLYKLQYQDKN